MTLSTFGEFEILKKRQFTWTQKKHLVTEATPGLLAR